MHVRKERPVVWLAAAAGIAWAAILVGLSATDFGVRGWWRGTGAMRCAKRRCSESAFVHADRVAAARFVALAKGWNMMQANESCTVVVTGASAGAGRATARHFGARGWRVALVSRDAARPAQTRREIEASGGTRWPSLPTRPMPSWPRAMP